MITASCHCGAVRMEIAEAPSMLTDCNCSICRRLGVLWAYYTPAQVKIDRAAGATLAYVWGDRMIEFHTCKTCGCTTHYEAVEKAGSERTAVNARLMEPEAIAGVRVRLLDGAGDWQVLGWTVHPPRPSAE